MAEWLVRKTHYLLIAVSRRSNPRPSLIFANSRLISIFLIALSKAVIFVMFCHVCYCLRS